MTEPTTPLDPFSAAAFAAAKDHPGADPASLLGEVLGHLETEMYAPPLSGPVGAAAWTLMRAMQMLEQGVPYTTRQPQPLDPTQTLDLMRRAATPPCTCLTPLQDDAYDPGGPMSGHKRPPPCALHNRRVKP